MGALDDMRGAEIAMDMELQPIEECYAFLSRCGVSVPREEMERVDSLRYTFKNLQSQAVSDTYFITPHSGECIYPLQSSVQAHLVSIQPQFKNNLLESVAVFKNDIAMFSESYHTVSYLPLKCTPHHGVTPPPTERPYGGWIAST